MAPDLDRILGNLGRQRQSIDSQLDDTTTKVRTEEILQKLEELRRRAERTNGPSSDDER